MTEQSRLSQRKPGEPPHGLAEGRLDAQTASTLYLFLKKLVNSLQGIPGGFKDTAPKPVIMGVAGDADAGTKEASWMAADVQPVMLTGVPAGLGNANAEGSSTRGARLDHVHKRDARVKQAGSDIGIRNAVNFSSDFTVTDNPGSDSVDVSIDVDSIASDSIFYAHHLIGGY